MSEDRTDKKRPPTDDEASKGLLAGYLNEIEARSEAFRERNAHAQSEAR